MAAAVNKLEFQRYQVRMPFFLPFLLPVLSAFQLSQGLKDIQPAKEDLK